MKESWVQTAIMEYLSAKHILAFRMNTGAMKMDKRFVRFGVPGMADILAFPVQSFSYEIEVSSRKRTMSYTVPTWIECKATKGVQSDLQKSFQKHVEEHGHRYVVARSIEDVENFL